NSTAAGKIYYPSLHDALPIFQVDDRPPPDAPFAPGAEFPDGEVDVGAPFVARGAVDDQVVLDGAGQELHPILKQPRQVHLDRDRDRKSTRLNSSHDQISYAVF